MWLNSAVYDPRRYRAEQIYFNALRATFDDPLPIYDYAPLHPLMIHGHWAENRARQAAVLGAIASFQAEEKKRGQEMAQQFQAANPPKPGEPGYKPPQQPGQQPYRPSQEPSKPAYNPPPGEPGHDPNQPYDPNAPQPFDPTVP